MWQTSLLLTHLVGIVTAAQGSSQLRRPLAGKGASNKSTQSFLLDGVELNLATDEVAGDFCDATSPLSLAGYMNGAFSKTFHRELCVSPYVECCLPSLSLSPFVTRKNEYYQLEYVIKRSFIVLLCFECVLF